MITVLLLIASVAVADDSPHEIINNYKQLLRVLRVTVDSDDNVNREIKKLADQVKKLRAARKARGDQGKCSDCVGLAKDNCNNTKVCKSEDCKVDIQPTEDICYRIYETKACYQKALSASQRARINNCWKVANSVEADSVESELEALKDSQKELSEKRDDTNEKITALEDEYPYLKEVKKEENIRNANEKRKGDAKK